MISEARRVQSNSDLWIESISCSTSWALVAVKNASLCTAVSKGDRDWTWKKLSVERRGMRVGVVVRMARTSGHSDEGFQRVVRQCGR